MTYQRQVGCLEEVFPKFLDLCRFVDSKQAIPQSLRTALERWIWLVLELAENERRIGRLRYEVNVGLGHLRLLADISCMSLPEHLLSDTQVAEPQPFELDDCPPPCIEFWSGIRLLPSDMRIEGRRLTYAALTELRRYLACYEAERLAVSRLNDRISRFTADMGIGDSQ